MVNISLGYTVFDDFDGYTPQMLDGRTALCSRFLDSLLDAHPRMVVVQSAGNEGKNKWRHISFPGDVAEAVTVGALEESIRRGAKGLLKDVSLFDIYRGPGVAIGKKSVAFNLVLRADDRSLTGEEADEDVQSILAALKADHNAVLR